MNRYIQKLKETQVSAFTILVVFIGSSIAATILTILELWIRK